MYIDLGTGVRRSKDVPRITYVLKSALVPDLIKRDRLIRRPIKGDRLIRRG